MLKNIPTIKNISGFNYTREILDDNCQIGLLAWLGFRPFDENELELLMDQFSASEINNGLLNLRRANIVESHKNKSNRWFLTRVGQNLRSILINTAIWGRGQIDNQNGNNGEKEIIQPDQEASLGELLRFRDQVGRMYFKC
ncbi:hypothetical protein AALA17_01495 [Lactobacillaceae bacterium 24-114]